MKVLLSFSFTNLFGPIIKMISTMIKQLLVFSVVWIMVVVLFLGIGQLLFFDITTFGDSVSSMTYLL